MPPPRGERGASVDSRLCSGVRVLPVVRLTWLGCGGGCTDLALVALEVVSVRVLSDPEADDPSMDDLVESPYDRSPSKLGRLLCAVRDSVSKSAITPGPIDLRGGLPMLVLDTGG